MKGVCCLFAILAGLALMPATAPGHALQPGYLSIEPLGPATYRVFWRKPDVQGRPMPIDALLPETCEPRRPPPVRFDGVAWVSGWVTACENGLAGGRVEITGLERTSTDVLVRYQTPDGLAGSRRLTPMQPAFAVPEQATTLNVLRTYIVLGGEHILEGWDHLLFVLALMILVRDPWRLVGAVTAFTVAHSITLSAATLGWVALPPRPVEAVIALSIMFLASEILHHREGRLRLSERAPWLVTFSFGLLHGFGFAGALREIGLPQQEIPLALVAFNIGVELGQLAFILVIAALAALAVRVFGRVLAALNRLGAKPLAYGIGGLSGFWFVERLAAF
ncbi:MAG: HupE/UreJ family protein [Pseudomonadota bacterium]